MPLTTYTAGQVLTAASLNANFSFAASGVVQVQSATKTDTFTTTATTFTDITGLSISITPTSASNKILIIASVTASNDAATIQGGLRLVRNSTAIFVGDTAGNRISGQMVDVTNADSTVTQGISFLDSPATTSATTYKLQAINSAAGTFYVNRSENDTNDVNHYRGASSITVLEVTP